MALPPPAVGKKPPPGTSSAIPADLPPDVGAPAPGALPPDAGLGGPPPGMDPGLGGPPPGTPVGPPGPPQFPSADPNAILGLLMQLNAHDQQALGVAQVQADGTAFAQLLQSQPDPMAQAASSAPSAPAGPPVGAGMPGY